ncbi:hypothetical protein BH09BAC6_BH09BAC6_25490 [soil metagenome]
MGKSFPKHSPQFAVVLVIIAIPEMILLNLKFTA